MADFGIKISAKGKDAKAASGTDVFLNVKYPFAKLDVRNPKSFQNINLVFTNDTPEPPADSTSDTLVYSFSHGYSYVPSVWVLVQVAAAPPLFPNIVYPYFQDRGVCVDNGTTFYLPYFYTTIVGSNVYFYISKIRSSLMGNVTTNITGLQLKIRCYVFAEDITSSSP